MKLSSNVICQLSVSMPGYIMVAFFNHICNTVRDYRMFVRYLIQGFDCNIFLSSLWMFQVNVVYYCCEPATINVRHQHHTRLKRKASKGSRSANRDSFHPCFCHRILSLHCWASLLSSMLISVVAFMRNKLFSTTLSSSITVNGKNLMIFTVW